MNTGTKKGKETQARIVEIVSKYGVVAGAQIAIEMGRELRSFSFSLDKLIKEGAIARHPYLLGNKKIWVYALPGAAVNKAGEDTKTYRLF